MEQFSSFFFPVFERAPWLSEGLIWVGIFLLVFLSWIITGFPVLLIEGFVSRKRIQYSEFLKNIRSKLENNKKENSSDITQHKKVFLESRRTRSIADLSLSFWNNPIRKAARVADRIEKRFSRQINKTGKVLKNSLESFLQTFSKIETLTDKLRQASSNLEKEIPDSDQLKPTYESALQVKRASWTFFFLSLLLLGLVAINTVFLSQVLRALQFGMIKIYGGIWLYHIFACLLTFLEAGLGAFQGWQAVKAGVTTDQTFAKKLLSDALVYVIVLLLACVEGFWYSQLGTSGAGEALVIFSINFSLMHALGFMGFVLPLCLFLLGHGAFGCLMIILEGATLGRMRSGFKLCQKIQNNLQMEIPKSEDRIKNLHTQMEFSKNTLPHFREEADRQVREAVEALRQEIADLNKAFLEKAGSAGSSLSDSEIWRQVRKNSALIPLTILVAWLSIWLQKQAFDVLYPNWPIWVTLVLPIAQVVFLLIAGILLRFSERIADEKGNIVGGASTGSLTLGVLSICVVFSMNTYVLINEAIPNQLGMILGVVMGIGLILIVLGRDLPEMFSIIRYFFSWLMFYGKYLFMEIFYWILAILLGLLMIVEIALEFVTLPARWILKFFSRGRISSSPLITE